MSDLEWLSAKAFIRDLEPYEHNPRQITKEKFQKLVESIKEFGYRNRIICDVHGRVIGGHQRIKALIEAGYSPADEIEILIPNRELTQKEFDRINVNDNIPFGDWDMDELSNIFDIPELLDMGFDENLLPKMPSLDEVPAEPDPEPVLAKMAQCPNCGESFDYSKHKVK